VLELLEKEGIKGIRVKRLGIPDRFIEHGSQAQLRKDLGLDAAGIAKAVQIFLSGKSKTKQNLSFIR
jgi:1-deoxy-D-xylulose-5-phosphate synthase